MASIELNQRRAYVAAATDAATILASRLKPLSPAQQAAILASVAHECGCPVGMHFWTGEREDAMAAAMILDGHLMPNHDGDWSWTIGSGCSLRIEVRP